MYSLPFAPLFLLLSSACVASSDQKVLQETTDSSCHNACQALSLSLGSLTHVGLSPSHGQKFFATQQANLIPACIFTPSSPRDLSVGLQTIKSYGCHFAIRSGGHSSATGWSNSDGGVSIDLGEFKDVELVKDGIARVGTGAKWGDVFDFLEPFNLSVVGGRVSDVGVGGLILGGGISYISRRYGWAIDNVKNFEVVLANNSIVNVNQDSAPDLFWALRGGGNNFGIVTRFDLQTYTQGPMWGGFNFHLMSYSDLTSRQSRLNLTSTSSLPYVHSFISNTVSLIWRALCVLGYCIPVNTFFETWQNTTIELANNLHAANTLLSFAYVADVNLHLGCTIVHYTSTVGGPAAYGSISKLPKVYNTYRNASIRDFCDEQKRVNLAGSRNLWLAATFRLNSTLISHIYNIFLSETPSIRLVRGGGAGVNFQPIFLDTIPHFSKNGGNPLGLFAQKEPLMMFGITIKWKHEADDAAVHAFGEAFLQRAVDEGKKMGLWHPYIYQNYAGKGQDVFEGYGEENRKRLREIRGKYDPEEVFGRLVPGGFKI